MYRKGSLLAVNGLCLTVNLMLLHTHECNVLEGIFLGIQVLRGPATCLDILNSSRLQNE